jgi:hypothetical protein
MDKEFTPSHCTATNRVQAPAELRRRSMIEQSQHQVLTTFIITQGIRIAIGRVHSNYHDFVIVVKEKYNAIGKKKCMCYITPRSPGEKPCQNIVTTDPDPCSHHCP